MKDNQNMYSKFGLKREKTFNEIRELKRKQDEKARRASIVFSALIFTLIIFTFSVIDSAINSNQSVSTLTISSESLTIERNEFIVLDFNTDINLHSSLSDSINCVSVDENIAVVVNGKVYGLSVGEASIKCSIEEVESNSLLLKVIDTKSLVVNIEESDISVISPITSPPVSVEQPVPPVIIPPVNNQNPALPAEPPIVEEQPNNYIPPPLPTTPIITSNQSLIVSVLDVGQGDSILLQTPNKKYILIDAGNSSNGISIENYLREQGVSKIDVVIATHPHADHIGGMTHIIENFEIGSIYMPNVKTTTQTFERLLLAIQGKGLKINTAKAGVIIDIDSTLDIRLLAPVSSKYNELNQHSSVLKVTYQFISFLFAGDAGQESEQEMISSEVNLKADVLKVGHHGSKTSTTDSFLKAVSPKFGVVSVGASNRYGHPNQEVIDRLHQYGVETLRTDVHGTVVFKTDGTRIEINK